MHVSLIWCVDHVKTMGKAVAVLGSNESVSGTIYFDQEGDGNMS